MTRPQNPKKQTTKPPSRSATTTFSSFNFDRNMGKKQAGICNDEKLMRAPKGHFVVFVGEEMRRYMVPLTYLKNHTFQQLLQKSAEEYGFGSQKSIVLPCKELTFIEVTDLVSCCGS